MFAPKTRPFVAICAAIYLSLAALGAAAAAYLGWTRLSLRYELDYGEGTIMWQVLNVFDRHRAYAGLDSGHLVIWNYPPLYLLTVRLFHRFTPGLLWTGRFVSYASALGVAAILCAILYKTLPARWGRAPRLTAAATGLLFLCTEVVLHWMPFMRVDFLGLLATYLGLFFFLTSSARPRKQYLAFFFFFLAIWTKQTFLAAPFVCLTLLFFLAPRRALRICFAFGSAGLLLFWLGMHWTAGCFALHLFRYNVHPFLLSRALSGIGENFYSLRLLLAFSAALLLVILMRPRQPRKPWNSAQWKARLLHNPFFLTLLVETLHFLCALLISFTYGKIGSNVNYFLEWTASAVVLCGCVVGLFFRQAQRLPRLNLQTFSALLFSMLLTVQIARETLHTVSPRVQHRLDSASDPIAYSQILPLLQQARGPVISEDMVLLSLAGKDLVFEPATMKFLEDAGTWDSSAFRRRIASQEFALIVTTYLEYWRPEVLAAVHQSYQLQLVSGRYQVYRPRDGSLPPP